jgi:hypothetical protein
MSRTNARGVAAEALDGSPDLQGPGIQIHVRPLDPKRLAYRLACGLSVPVDLIAAMDAARSRDEEVPRRPPHRQSSAGEIQSSSVRDAAAQREYSVWTRSATWARATSPPMGSVR